MNEDPRARILRMVANGRITAEEAAEILEAMEPEASASSGVPAASQATTLERRKSLILRISEEGQTKVNLRVPLGLARGAGKIIPRQAHDYLQNYDINVQELLADLTNSLTTGPLVDIQDQDVRVLIAVE